MIFFLFLTLIFLVKNQNTTSNAPKKDSLLKLYKNSVSLIITPKVISLLLAGFGLFFGFLGMITFLTYRLVEPPFNFSAGEAGLVSFAGLTAIIAPFSGNISQKTGVFKIIIPGLIICFFALTKDISLNGLKIHTDVKLDIDTVLKIEIVLAKSKKLISIIGRVKWVSQLYDGEVFETGVEFIDTPPDRVLSLLDHLYGEKKNN